MRNTNLRKIVLDVFKEFQKPFSVPDLQAVLNQKKCTPNKTSLYRLLQRMEKEDLVESILLDSRTIFYEYKDQHHHHFVCEGCNEIHCIRDKKLEKTVCELENKLKKKGLQIQSHQFSFSGLCLNCAR